MLNSSPISDRTGYKLALKSEGQQSFGEIHCFKTGDSCPNDKSLSNVKLQQHQMRSYVFQVTLCKHVFSFANIIKNDKEKATGSKLKPK